MFKTLVDEILGDRFTQYLLEVIQTNSPALTLYKKQGFVIQRELSCFKISREALISLGKLQDNSEDRWQGSRKDRSIESGFEDRKDRSNESGYEDRKDSSNESGFEGRKDRSDGSEFEHRSESRKVPEIERRKDVGNDKKEVTEKGLEIEIRRIRNPHWNVLRKFWSFQPSWQNSIRSVERMGGFTIIGAYQNDQIIGYAVFDPLHGNIVQIAVDYESRGRGIGTSLMNHIIKETDGCPGLRVLNVEKTERDTMEFFTNLGFENDVDQFEMILDLRK